MMSTIDELLAQEGTAAEQNPLPEELPGHVTVGRPNLGRSTVVSVRLSAREFDQLHQAAGDAQLPLSTLLRVLALKGLHTDSDSDSTAAITQRLARLEHAVFHTA